MLLAFAGRGEQEDLRPQINQDIVLEAMLFLLAIIVKALEFWVFGPLDRPFGAILEENLPSFRRQMQFCHAPGGSLAQVGQSLVQTRIQNMDPLIRHRLRHIENSSKNILRGAFAQIHQDKHQFVFDRLQRVVAVLDTLTATPPTSPLFPFQRVTLHPHQKAGAKGGQQRLEFFMGEPGQRNKLLPFLGKSGIIAHGEFPF